MTWFTIIIAGIITYCMRMTMVALVDRDLLGERVKAVLAYVPSAVFPAIIFPGIFIDDAGLLIDIYNPKLFASVIAVLVGYFSRNVIATIISGLFSYWIIIFLL